MKRISQEQWFWEQCGFKYGKEGDYSVCYYPEGYDAGLAGGYRTYEYYKPDLDLNNLFKYAVPKAIDKSMERLGWSKNAALDILFANWLHELKKDLKHPALALFWAIYKALSGEY